VSTGPRACLQVLPDEGLRAADRVPFWHYFPGADFWGPRELLIAGDLLWSGELGATGARLAIRGSRVHSSDVLWRKASEGEGAYSSTKAGRPHLPLRGKLGWMTPRAGRRRPESRNAPSFLFSIRQLIASAEFSLVAFEEVALRPCAQFCAHPAATSPTPPHLQTGAHSVMKP
jgi:hypothetical protein